MASDKLRKYLAYYQKVLREDPENIEARLRLAAIFREMGRKNHAVEEYSTASKLLARVGLPLEAIAACKAVLELDHTQTESQFFLARLYAQVPASGARIAQPLAGPQPTQSASVSVPRSMQDFESAELDNAVSMIDLVQPKKESGADTRTVDVLETVWNRHNEETRQTPVEGVIGVRDTLEEQTDSIDFDIQEITGVLEDREMTMEIDPVYRDPELYATVDLLPDDILESIDAPRERHDTIRIASQHPDLTKTAEQTETIRLGVFDMASLELDDEEFDLPELEDFEVSDADEGFQPTDTAVVNVSRHGLPEIPLFSRLSQRAFMGILQAIEIRRYQAGDVLLSPDDSRRSLFVIVKGQTRIWRTVESKDVDLAEMGEGEFFGEFRLLTGRDGMATVSAKTDVEVFELSESDIAVIGEANPEVWDVLWDFYFKRMLNNLLASQPMFRRLEAPDRVALAKAFVQVEVLQGEFLLKTGDPCTHLYLVMAGEVTAERDLGGLVQTLAEMREGEFFGVASTLAEEPYPANVRALRDTVLYALPSEHFRKIVDDHVEVARAVHREMRKRRALNSQFSSGVTNYAELGIAKDPET
jgi:CRP-like cAMP-binding protein